jgi:pimeloyl-ACP methyl ester carboxylesterase
MPKCALNSGEKQTAALLAAGHRVITYDRRGFGKSSKPAVGYNYDTFKADLDAVLNTLKLTDVSLVGFSMGTGEVTRYIGKYDVKRVRKAVLIGTLGPYLVKTADNPEGVDRSVLEGLKAAIKADRPATGTRFHSAVGVAHSRSVPECAAPGLTPHRLWNLSPERSTFASTWADSDHH